VATFNFLNDEGRVVVGALLPHGLEDGAPTEEAAAAGSAEAGGGSSGQRAAARRDSS
jgi:hypothetical protein